MKSFNMLETIGADGDTRYFIDGTRVGYSDYNRLKLQAKRQDTFHSYQFAGRAHFRSVIYV